VLKTVVRLYDGLVIVLASIAGAILAVSFVVIIYDVVMRNFLFTPPAWSVPLIEYGLLYMTMLAAPWMVRTRGHVLVEAVRMQVSSGTRRLMASTVYVFCIAISLVLAVYVGELLLDAIASGETDVRAIEISRAWLFTPMLVAFVLMAIEFARFLFGHGSLYEASVEKPSDGA